jgi:predicted nucleotidyltransferase
MRHPQTYKIMNELRDRLIDTYSDQLIAIILFGSQARGDATPNSDFDVLIVLKDPVKTGKEIERTGYFLSPLCLKYNIVICNLFLSVTRFENEQTMLMQNITKEGIYFYDKRAAISRAKSSR